ncbi:MAG TPA: hypothetical protein VIV10_12770 [Gemmatimonadales bacterium]
MRNRLTIGLALLRATGIGAVLVLLVNPTRSRPEPVTGPPLVLLDASLSMAGPAGPWQAALDSARRLAAGGPIWRFGSGVAAFDSGPPVDGATRLAPALAAAAARGGAVVVVTDGAVADAADLPADLRRRPRVLVLPRARAFDAFVASIDGPRRVVGGDTIRLRVAYGTAGKREEGRGKSASLTVTVDDRRLSNQSVTLPDSGVAVREITLPSSLFPLPGSRAFEVRLEGVDDSEPRDDARTFVIEVSPQPTAVVLAAPPDWESRFFAKTLSDVARVPVKLFVRTEPGRWRDAATLAPVASDALSRTVAGARLVALIGDPAALAPFRRRFGVLFWPLSAPRDGDWYVDPPPASLLAGSLAGVAWDSLPPAAGLTDIPIDSATIVPLTVRLGRRGSPRPLLVLRDSTGSRSVTVAGTGLWRWDFRGGAPAEAYRTFVAAIADWLLAERGAGSGERFVPVTLEAANGLPLEWRWSGRGTAAPVSIQLESNGRTRTDTLRFDASGQAELRLPPAVYRWHAADGPEHGLVAVERYSDEWRPAPVTLEAQAGEPSGSRRDVGARDRWWLYVLALAAFVAEWAWRRRQGLP